MSTIYVVKRPFRSIGVFYAVGSIIEDPSAIKLLKTKVSEGKILEVNKDSLDRIAEYVKTKTGVDNTELYANALESVTVEEPVATEPVVTEPVVTEPVTTVKPEDVKVVTATVSTEAKVAAVKVAQAPKE